PNCYSITCIQSSVSPFYPFLKKFPDLTNPVCRDTSENHFATHSIITHGNHVKARVHRLALTRYEIAKGEFERMFVLGIIRNSFSNWLFTHYMVLKKFSVWCSCGYYHGLSSVTVTDNYPMSDIKKLLIQSSE
ncbi:unnamed protein product, partial [Hymenolepis diminuta]